MKAGPRDAAKAALPTASVKSAGSDVKKRLRESKETGDTSDDLLSIEQLHQRAKENRLRHACSEEVNGKYQLVSMFASVRQLGSYGLGVQLYFEMLTGLGVLFLLMLAAGLPAIIFAARGEATRQRTNSRDSWNALVGSTSIGNLGSIAGCNNGEGTCDDHDSLVSRPVSSSSNVALSAITPTLCGLDVLGLLLFLGYWLWFRYYRIPKLRTKNDEDHITACDYAICVGSLPRNLGTDHYRYAQELETHFNLVLTDAGITGKVREVSLVREYDGALRSLMQQGELLMQLRDLQARVRRGKKSNLQANELEKLEKNVTDCKATLARIEDSMEEQGKLRDEERLVCGAYIMFDHESQKEKVLEMYRRSHSSFGRRFQRQKLRFKGRALLVKQACNPEELQWENLDFHPSLHETRKCIVLLIATFLLVIVSVIFVYFRGQVNSIDTDIKSSHVWVIKAPHTQGEPVTAPCLELCNLQVDSSRACHWKDLSTGVYRVLSSQGIQWDVNDPSMNMTPFPQLVQTTCSPSTTWRSPYCSNHPLEVKKACYEGNSALCSDWIAVQFTNPQTVKCANVNPGASWMPDIPVEIFSCDSRTIALANSTGIYAEGDDGLIPWVVDDQCVQYQPIAAKHGQQFQNQMRTDSACTKEVSYDAAVVAKEEGETSSHGVRLACFCKQQAAKSQLFVVPPFTSNEQKICEQWIATANSGTGKRAVGIVILLALNMILTFIFSLLDAWSKYKTSTELADHQLDNLFWMMFITTGLITVLVGMQLHGYQHLRQLNIGTGQFDDITASWFQTLGNAIFTTITLQVVSKPVTALLWMLIVDPLTAWWFSRGVVTQELLNSVFTFPDWTLSLRLAETIVIVFCVMLYSGNYPMIYLIGALYYPLAYWIDKWVLLRGSRKPPMYRAQIIMAALDYFPLCAFLHVCFTMWSFGNQELFPSDWSPIGQASLLNLMHMTEDEYDSIQTRWRQAETTERVDMYHDYVRSRIVDSGRQGVYPLYWIFWILIVLFIFQFVASVTRSFCPWVTAAFRRTCLKMIAAPPEKEHYDDVVNSTKRTGIFSYKMSANPRYQAAFDALEYDPEPDSPKAAEKGAAPPAGEARSSTRKSYTQGVASVFGKMETMIEQTADKMGFVQ